LRQRDPGPGDRLRLPDRRDLVPDEVFCRGIVDQLHALADLRLRRARHGGAVPTLAVGAGPLSPVRTPRETARRPVARPERGVGLMTQPAGPAEHVPPTPAPASRIGLATLLERG